MGRVRVSVGTQIPKLKQCCQSQKVKKLTVYFHNQDIHRTAFSQLDESRYILRKYLDIFCKFLKIPNNQLGPFITVFRFLKKALTMFSLSLLTLVTFLNESTERTEKN